jgi:hypothetical protein
MLLQETNLQSAARCTSRKHPDKVTICSRRKSQSHSLCLQQYISCRYGLQDGCHLLALAPVRLLLLLLTLLLPKAYFVYLWVAEHSTCEACGMPNQ